MLQIVHKCKRHVKIKPKQNKILKKKQKTLQEKLYFSIEAEGKIEKLSHVKILTKQVKRVLIHSFVRLFILFPHRHIDNIPWATN